MPDGPCPAPCAGAGKEPVAGRVGKAGAAGVMFCVGRGGSIGAAATGGSIGAGGGGVKAAGGGGTTGAGGATGAGEAAAGFTNCWNEESICVAVVLPAAANLARFFSTKLGCWTVWIGSNTTELPSSMVRERKDVEVRGAGAVGVCVMLAGREGRRLMSVP